VKTAGTAMPANAVGEAVVPLDPWMLLFSKAKNMEEHVAQTPALPASKTTHGDDNRGLAAGAIPGVAFGRYGQMFDGLSAGNRLPPGALWDLAKAMIKVDAGAPIDGEDKGDENPTIPAGYTYFGQFVDHDLTLDPSPFNTSERDPEALVDFRSPALDLDNIYGRGPDDQPYMYMADGLRLVVGDAPGNAGAKVGTQADLFRVQAGDRTNVPIIGDKRNDENKIVSQLHGALIRFHNKVVQDDSLIIRFGGDPANPTSRFKAAANIVRWHYQWVVVFDYLDRICEPGMVDEVLNPRGTPHLNNYIKGDATYPYMPVEFAGAAFRFGHSMVRPSYALNRLVGTETKTVDGKDPNRIPTFNRDPASFENLNGFPGPLPKDWGIDWGFFFDLSTAELTPDQADKTSDKRFRVPQPSYRIDALLVSPLGDLPEFFKTTDPKDLVDQIGADQIKPPPGASAQQTLVGHLAFRNLLRGQKLGLPSGQAVARKLGIEPLSEKVLWSAGSRLLNVSKLNDDDKGALDKTTKARSDVLAKWGDQGLKGCAPLWYYVLREGEYYGVTNDPNEPLVGMGGQHLGPVGSRIVAETIIGILWCDRTSFLHDLRGFQPLPEITRGGKLTVASLLAYALN
jgi:hypothetical protein